MKVLLVPQAPPRSAAQGQSAEHVFGRLLADLQKKPLERESAVDSFAAAMNRQPIDGDYLTLCLMQMAHLHAKDIVNDGQFESIMTTLVQATDGDNMEATAKEFIHAAQQLRKKGAEGVEGAEGSGRELTLAALRALGRAVNAMPHSVANAAANAVADMTGRIKNGESAKDLFSAFWDAAAKSPGTFRAARRTGCLPPGNPSHAVRRRVVGATDACESLAVRLSKGP